MPAQRQNHEIIDNCGPNTLQSHLASLLAKASSADIAVAFISEAGLKKVLPRLRQVATRGKVRVLTGLYQGITEPMALRTLLRAQREMRGRLAVSLSTERAFHQKTYLIASGQTVTAVIGSSNLTAEGLRGGGEFNIAVSLPRSSRPVARLIGKFDQNWRHFAVPLDVAKIERYDRLRRRVKRDTQVFSIPLREILGPKKPSPQEALESSEPIAFWRDCIGGYAKPNTEQVVRETTDWDERGWGWYTGGKNKFTIGDRIVLFNFADGAIRVVQVASKEELDTPDGRYFVAYGGVRGIPQRKMTKRRREMLKREGLVRSIEDMSQRRKLSSTSWDSIISIVRKD